MGAIPDGEEPDGHTALCAEVVRMRLTELRQVGRALAQYQPAVHAETQEEADLWAKFYLLLEA